MDCSGIVDGCECHVDLTVLEIISNTFAVLLPASYMYISWRMRKKYSDDPSENRFEDIKGRFSGILAWFGLEMSTTIYTKKMEEAD